MIRETDHNDRFLFSCLNSGAELYGSGNTIHPHTAIHEQMVTINGYGKVCTTSSTPSTTVRP